MRAEFNGGIRDQRGIRGGFRHYRWIWAEFGKELGFSFVFRRSASPSR